MSTLQFDTLKSADGGNSIAQATIFSGTAKAWSNLDGTGTIAERDSLNVSGYTDNGTGDYTFSYSNAFGAADYAVMQWGGTANVRHFVGRFHTIAAGSYRGRFDEWSGAANGASSPIDNSQAHNLCHGDLA